MQTTGVYLCPVGLWAGRGGYYHITEKEECPREINGMPLSIGAKFAISCSLSLFTNWSLLNINHLSGIITSGLEVVNTCGLYYLSRLYNSIFFQTINVSGFSEYGGYDEKKSNKSHLFIYSLRHLLIRSFPCHLNNGGKYYLNKIGP